MPVPIYEECGHLRRCAHRPEVTSNFGSIRFRIEGRAQFFLRQMESGVEREKSTVVHLPETSLRARELRCCSAFWAGGLDLRKRKVPVSESQLPGESVSSRACRSDAPARGRGTRSHRIPPWVPQGGP